MSVLIFFRKLINEKIPFLFYIQSAPMTIQRGYSSGVEHSTADREDPGSIPGVPLFCPKVYFIGKLKTDGYRIRIKNCYKGRAHFSPILIASLVSNGT